jgi:hypothetical protein
MNYTYNITAELIVEIFIDGTLVDFPGPWTDLEAATGWAEIMISDLKTGKYEYSTKEPK